MNTEPKLNVVWGFFVQLSKQIPNNKTTGGILISANEKLIAKNNERTFCSYLFKAVSEFQYISL